MDTPPPGALVDDLKPPAAPALSLAVTRAALKPVSLINDLNEQPVGVQRGTQADRALAMAQGVRGQLADHQSSVGEQIAIKAPGAQAADRTPRDQRRRRRA